MRGNGCQICAGTIKLSQEEFIQKAKEKHGTQFLYDEVCYENMYTYIKIFCTKCNEFILQTPQHHLQYNCVVCRDRSRDRQVLTENFIKIATQVHGNKYLYDKTIVIRMSDPVEIFCIKCNEYYFQKPTAHAKGVNHPKCIRPVVLINYSISRKEK